MRGANTRSVCESRGENWALPGRARTYGNYVFPDWVSEFDETEWKKKRGRAPVSALLPAAIDRSTSINGPRVTAAVLLTLFWDQILLGCRSVR